MYFRRKGVLEGGLFLGACLLKGKVFLEERILGGECVLREGVFLNGNVFSD